LCVVLEICPGVMFEIHGHNPHELHPTDRIIESLHSSFFEICPGVMLEIHGHNPHELHPTDRVIESLHSSFVLYW
jgi:hypothetical protein